jgi:membrane-anchored glycerophosphoryl diester phosphodiesterase (GDPDase)
MSAQPGWTPAARPGIIPLHPLTFGAVLGRSFQALRHNPKVLLGFALGVQSLVFILLIVGIAGVGWLSFSRLDTLTPGTDEWDAVTAGSVLVTALAGLVLGLLASALQVIVQAVVVGEVAHAVVAEKLTLGALWRQVRPSLWRLLGYTFLVLLAVVLFVAAVGGVVFAVGAAAGPVLAVVLTILVILGCIPLYLWLSTKLLLAPSAIILERASVRGAIARSWRLTRRRFWPILGVIVVISLLFGVIAQFVQIPFSLLSSGFLTVFAPTGEPGAEAVIGFVVAILLGNIVVLLVQAVALVVQATASVLLYVDCRMRHEGLDIDLLTYVERRDAGAATLEDPWTVHPGRPAPMRVPAYGAPAYGAPAQPPYGYAQPPYGYAQPPYGYPAPSTGLPPHGYAPQPSSAPSPPAPPAATQWTAPGAGSADREPPPA